MNTTVLNGQLQVSYPDGFRQMDAEELGRLFPKQVATSWGIWDTDRHIVVTVLWNESNALLSKLVSNKDLAKRLRKHLTKAYANNGFRAQGIVKTEISGTQACGFDFAYQVEGIDQVGEIMVFRHVEGHTCCCYTIYYYTREERAAQSREVLEEILASMRLA